MADPRLKQLKIKAGIVKRIAKEKECYVKESEKLAEKLIQMQNNSAEAINIKKHKELVDESKMMIPDCQHRLEKAVQDLENVIRESEPDLIESKEYEEAKAQLEAVQKT